MMSWTWNSIGSLETVNFLPSSSLRSNSLYLDFLSICRTMSLPFVRLLMKGLTPGIANHQLVLFLPTSLTSRIPLLTRVLCAYQEQVIKTVTQISIMIFFSTYDTSSWLSLWSFVSLSRDTLTSLQDGRTFWVKRLHRAVLSAIHETM